MKLPPASLKYSRWSNFISKKSRNFFNCFFFLLHNIYLLTGLFRFSFFTNFWLVELPVWKIKKIPILPTGSGNPQDIDVIFPLNCMFMCFSNMCFVFKKISFQCRHKFHTSPCCGGNAARGICTRDQWTGSPSTGYLYLARKLPNYAGTDHEGKIMILYFSLHFKEREAIQSCLSWKETFTICTCIFFYLKIF